jgi:hypothetical protein
MYELMWLRAYSSQYIIVHWTESGKLPLAFPPDFPQKALPFLQYQML